jgi:hypothetical protein
MPAVRSPPIAKIVEKTSLGRARLACAAPGKKSLAWQKRYSFDNLARA